MIIDAHIHVYDPYRSEGVPWPPKDDPLLYRTVTPEHYRRLAVPVGVHGALVVEASPWPHDNQWVLDQIDGESYVLGEIGNLEPATPSFRPLLVDLARNPGFRGIRRPCPDGAHWGTAEYARDLALLAELGLTLDVMVHGDWAELDRLAAQFPMLPMVVCHLGHPRTTGGAPEPNWASGIALVARHPNVYCKISGVAESAIARPAPTDPGYYEPVLDVVWEAFGEDRVVFGSNWPVCELAAPFDDVVRLARAYGSKLGADAVGKLLWRNGIKAYGWRLARAEAIRGRVEVIQGDIAHVDADAIVNAANSSLLGGSGVDGAIHGAPGPQLAQECAALGGCAPGEAKITSGYRLATRHVIHTVGPIWRGGQADEDVVLARCYRNSLSLAADRGLRTVAFPAISTGAYGFPEQRAVRIAVDEIGGFLAAHELPLKVLLVCFSPSSCEVIRGAVAEAGGEVVA